MTSTDPPNGAELPAQPDGTRFDGDPLFEALVYGWASSDNSWNGETDVAGELGSGRAAALSIRTRLAGHFEQHLAQTPDPAVGDRVMLPLPGGVWLHGEVIETDHESARIRWDAWGPHGGNVGHVASDHYGRLVREPKR